MLRVKNMHLGSSSEPWGTWGEEKLSYAHYSTQQGEVEFCILKLTSVFHHSSQVHRTVGHKQLCAVAHLECTYDAATS